MRESDERRYKQRRERHAEPRMPLLERLRSLRDSWRVFVPPAADQHPAKLKN